MSEFNLIDFIRELLSNADLLHEFQDAPHEVLEEHGLGHLSTEDVQDALVLIDEDNQHADFSRSYDTGSNHVAAAAHEPAEHESPAEYINRYVTNNYVNDDDTTVDNSTNQQIDTHGGDFEQFIDVDSTVASGDGAVAAGGDIDGSTIVTGSHNQVGDGNVSGNGNVVGNGNQAVTGDDNTTSFGDGDANSLDVDGHLTVGEGAAFATGGSAQVDNSDNSTNDSNNDFSDNSVNHSGNDFSDNSTNDSFNEDLDLSVSHSGNDNSETDISNSGNDTSDNSDNSDNSVSHSGNVEFVV